MSDRPVERNVESITEIIMVAISPILVMCMVGSLIFFATDCFYAGNFHGRLRFASGLFVMAAVLVARISIDEGREYASAFAVPLSIVTILSMMRYTDAGLLCIPLVAFIWWSTDRLTWDCTVVDFKKDASGEGLLQTIGVEEGDDAPEASHLDKDATTDKKVTESKTLWQRFVDRATTTTHTRRLGDLLWARRNSALWARADASSRT